MAVAVYGGGMFCYKKNEQLPEIIRDCNDYCYNKKIPMIYGLIMNIVKNI